MANNPVDKYNAAVTLQELLAQEPILRARIAELLELNGQLGLDYFAAKEENQRLQAELQISWMDLPGATAELVDAAPLGMRALMRQWVSELQRLQSDRERLNALDSMAMAGDWLHPQFSWKRDDGIRAAIDAARGGK